MPCPPPPPAPGAALPALWDAVVVRSLWSSLCGDDVRALRACCTPLRDAVDAQVGTLLEQGPNGGAAGDTAHVLSGAACARLCGVSTMTLRSMACVRAMLVASPGAFPRLQSVRLLLNKVGACQVHVDGSCTAAVARPHGGPHACSCHARAMLGEQPGAFSRIQSVCLLLNNKVGCSFQGLENR
jgi:hypothetical protein